MTPQAFKTLISRITSEIKGMSLDNRLSDFLNERFPVHSKEFQDIAAACHEAVSAGWMCANEHGGIKYGRVIDPCPDLEGYSVDVVEMADVVGPRHAHPKGEIDMIMPLEGNPKFDGHEAGWFVYGPGTVHRPTVNGGRAFILYLLPEGAIDFIRHR